MAVNIVEAVEAQLTPDAVNKVAESTGETQNKTRSAMSAGVLAVITAIVHRGSSRAGATSLLSTLQSAGGMPRGTALTSGLLGDNADQVTGAVARSSGTSRSTASTITSAILPLTAGVLGREVMSRKLDADGLSELLQSQKSHLLDRQNLLEASAAKDVGVYEAAVPRQPRLQPRVEPQKRSWLPLLALLLGALLLGALLLMFRGREPTAPRVSAPYVPQVEAPVVRAPELPSLEKPEVPRLPMPAGQEPTGQTTLTGAEIAKGDELAAHFDATGALPDRFALPGINFKFGTAEMTETGGATIDRLAALMKEHPKARVRLEGHTDSVGSPAVNAPLSAQRAAAVKKMLVDRGVEDSRIEAVGKREAEPVAPNDTREGRAQNRRIDTVILER
jgi:outer membrane protein OmpA-like peptidoglycan-associated protein